MKSKPASNTTSTQNLLMLDPDRISGKQYDLVHRHDTKLCPKTVMRCEQCRIAFNQADVVLVKSVGRIKKTD